MNSICFDQTYMILLIIAITAISLYNYYIYSQTIQNLQQNCPACPATVTRSPETSEPDPVKIIIKPEAPAIPPIPPINPLREYDRRTLDDPLVPPLKRSDYDPNPVHVHPGVFYNPTRGAPTSFKKMGILVDPEAENTDSYKFLNLMGRQKYLNGPYEYYVTSSNRDDNLKFDLPQIRKELYTDDTVTVTQLNKTYKVEIDRTLGFEYSPFVF